MVGWLDRRVSGGGRGLHNGSRRGRPGGRGRGRGSGASAEFSLIGTAYNQFWGGFNLSGGVAAYGVEKSGRVILVNVAWARSGSVNTREITSLTVGGTAATRISRQINAVSNYNSELWYVALPTNPANGTITPTWSGTSGSSAFSGLSVYRMVGFNMTPADAKSSQTNDPVLPAISYGAGGVIVGSFQYSQPAVIAVSGLDTLGLQTSGGYGAVTQGYSVKVAAGSQVVTVTHDPNDIEYISRVTSFNVL